MSKPKLLFCALAAVMGAIVVYRSQVTPYLDDWVITDVDYTWGWLWAPHNEHRMVPTHLLMTLLHALGLLKIPVVVGVNFAIFAAFAWMLGGPVAFVMLSPIAWEVHVYAVNSNITFTYLGVCAGAFALEKRRYLAASAWLVFAVFSSAAGLVGAVVVAGVFAARDRRALLVLGVAGASAVTWWILRPAGSPSLGASPLTREFWAYFLNLVGMAGGYTTHSVLIGLAVFAFGLKRKTTAATAIWLAMTVTLAALAYTRGATGWAKVSRYMVPCFVWLWATFDAWKHHPVRWLLLAGYLDNLDPYVYRVHEQRVAAGAACLCEKRDCPMLYPWPLDDEIKKAREKGLVVWACGLQQEPL